MNRLDLKELSYSELEELIYKTEHHEEYDESEREYIHFDWDCRKCDAEDEKKTRDYIKESKKAGNLPYFKNTVSTNVLVDQVKVGDYARYLSRPGTSDYPYEYAECLSINYDPETHKYVIVWRKTNTDDEPFAAEYSETDDVNIVRKL